MKTNAFIAGGGPAPAGTGAEPHTTPPRAPRGGKLKERVSEAERSADLPPDSLAATQGVE
ncbi:hypothetical protein [Nitrosococcus wardiae]|uniref:Uncharacterized protein n=1 Tax=Nitrosococcus wardiae TaxID=1814290 RepID=A0A4P7C3U1_9GAMM|nr:hypothetical protein [Nitrosococcus wardiae]QBQ56347.1 hypothetical protein E3U44_18970 [Nitrosococcus wardiae]